MCDVVELGALYDAKQRYHRLLLVAWSPAVVVQGLSAFDSRWFCLCRDGVVCFFKGECLVVSRAAGAPSTDEAQSVTTATVLRSHSPSSSSNKSRYFCLSD